MLLFILSKHIACFKIKCQVRTVRLSRDCYMYSIAVGDIKCVLPLGESL